MTVGGAVTVAIAAAATAATVQADLQALSTVNTVTVAGAAGGPYTVTWSGAQGNMRQPLMTANSTLLTGPGTQALTVATQTFSVGPNHYNDPLNWTGGRLPDTGDTAVFETGSSNCSFGLQQISTFTANTVTSVLTFASGNFINDQTVQLTTTGGLPAGLAAATTYYLISVNRDAQTCQLAATSGGAAIVITTVGTGVHTLGVRLTALQAGSRYTGEIGLPKTNANGYYEYRPLYLHIGLLAPGPITIGLGDGGGSGMVQIDSDVDQATVKVINTGSSIQAGVPPVLWKGINASSTLQLLNGDLGIALFAGELASLGATAPTPALVVRQGTIELGPLVTINGPVDRTGGILISDGATINGTVL